MFHLHYLFPSPCCLSFVEEEKCLFSRMSNKRKRKLQFIDDQTSNNDEPKRKRKRIKSELENDEEEEKEKVDKVDSKYVFILAHGAGTNSQHPNMKNWEQRLSKLGQVVTFDFKRPYNKMDKLVATYQPVIDSTIEKYPTHKLILIGTSMGSRVSIHLSNINSLPANCQHIIALGYPLLVKRKTGNKIRDTPLLEFINSDDTQLKQARLLLISGTKDQMAPKHIMNEFYDKVKDKVIQSKQKCVLHWIDGANHSLKVGKRHQLGQDQVYKHVIDIITLFLI